MSTAVTAMEVTTSSVLTQAAKQRADGAADLSIACAKLPRNTPYNA